MAQQLVHPQEQRAATFGDRLAVPGDESLPQVLGQTLQQTQRLLDINDRVAAGE